MGTARVKQDTRIIVKEEETNTKIIVKEEETNTKIIVKEEEANKNNSKKGVRNMEKKKCRHYKGEKSQTRPN